MHNNFIHEEYYSPQVREGRLSPLGMRAKYNGSTTHLQNVAFKYKIYIEKIFVLKECFFMTDYTTIKTKISIYFLQKLHLNIQNNNYNYAKKWIVFGTPSHYKYVYFVCICVCTRTGVHVNRCWIEIWILHSEIGMMKISTRLVARRSSRVPWTFRNPE